MGLSASEPRSHSSRAKLYGHFFFVQRCVEYFFGLYSLPSLDGKTAGVTDASVRGLLTAFHRQTGAQRARPGSAQDRLDRYLSVNCAAVAEFTEIESGKKHENRPALLAALDSCRKHRATRLIARLDRLARNVAFIASLMESEVEFVAVDMPHASKFTIHILAGREERVHAVPAVEGNAQALRL